MASSSNWRSVASRRKAACRWTTHVTVAEWNVMCKCAALIAAIGYLLSSHQHLRILVPVEIVLTDCVAMFLVMRRAA